MTLKDCAKKVHCEYGIINNTDIESQFCKIDTTTGCYYKSGSLISGGPTLVGRVDPSTLVDKGIVGKGDGQFTAIEKGVGGGSDKGGFSF